MKSGIKLTTQISTATIILLLSTSPLSANWFNDKFKPQEPQVQQGKIIDNTKSSSTTKKLSPKKENWFKRKFKKKKGDKKVAKMQAAPEEIKVAKKKDEPKKKQGNWFKRKFKKDKKQPARNVKPVAAVKKAVVKKTTVKKDVLLINSLKGITLVDKPAQLKENGVSGTGVSKSKSTLMPANVKKILQSQIGKKLTLNSLSTLTKAMMKAYSDSGIQITTVVAPEQDITNGSLQLLVVNGRLGKVKVANNKFFADKVYLKDFMIRKGEIIRTGRIVDDLRWINRNMFRRVDLVYSPGSGYAETDITLRASETRPRSFYIGANNTGSKGLGEERIFVGAQFGNLFKKDHTFSFQYTTNTESSKLNSIFADYRIPLKKRQEIRITAAKSDFASPVQGQVTTNEGDSASFGVDYYKNLRRLGSYSGDLHLGVQHKTSTNDVLLTGGTVALIARSDEYDYNQVSIGWQGDRLSGNSRTNIVADIVHTQGDRTGDNVADLKNTALKARVKHVRDYRNDTRLTIASKMQFSDDSVMAPSEEFFLGGNGSVRGFASNVSRDPSGVTINATYRGKNLLGKNKKLRGHQIRPYVFMDTGFGYTKDPSANEEKSKQITGAGVGVTYNYGRNVNLDLAYGAPVSDGDIPESLRDDAVVHFSLTARY